MLREGRITLKIKIHDEKCEIGNGIAVTKTVIKFNAIKKHDPFEDHHMINMQVAVAITYKSVFHTIHEKVFMQIDKIQRKPRSSSIGIVINSAADKWDH